MNFSKLTFILLIGLNAAAARAAGNDGTFQQLGEKPVQDQITIDEATKKAASTAPAKSEEAPTLSTYNQLDHFDDVVMLQKKYQPKRHRFELGAAYGTLTDNAFFDSKALYGRLGYYITETIALETLYFSAETKVSKISDSLLNNGGVLSSVSAAPAHYIGLDAKWSPIYGKIAFWNKSIIPVEQYFIVGLGKTDLNGQDPASTEHFGTGLSFALRKWLSVRVGLDVFAYALANGDHFNDTHLNIGFSTFFPEASYR